jgi:CheY-like chemotaxis protein
MYQPQPYVLLIDDDEEDLEMFSSGLEMKGVKVRAFDSPSKALLHLAHYGDMELPLLIMLDYNMPKKNGRQVLQEIKDNKSTGHIPVVMYSTSMSEVLKTQLLVDGALDCFSKPWTNHEFNGQVEKIQELAFVLQTTKKFV